MPATRRCVMKNSRGKIAARRLRLIAGVLRRDRIAQVALGTTMLGFAAAAGLPADPRAGGIVRLALSLFVPMACLYGARRSTRAVGRRFWTTVGLAFASWWLLSAAGAGAIAAGARPIVAEWISSLAFGALYLLLFAAVAGHAHAPLAGHRRGVDVLAQWPAASLLVISLTVYFLILPALIVPAAPRQPAALFLLVALDVYLTAQLAILARAAGPLRWRTVHALLAVMAGAWLAGDVDNGLRALRGMPLGGHDLLVVIWINAAVLAARVGITSDDQPRDQRPAVIGRAELLDPRTPAHTLAAAVALPIIHVGAWRLGLFALPLRGPQEVLLLAAITALGILAWLQHRMLHSVAAELERGRAEVEEAVQRRRVGRRLHRERERSEAAVQEVEDRFATVFRACPSAMVITRLDDGTIVDLNESFETLTGWNRHSCFGRTTLELGFWPEAEVRNGFAKRIAEGGVIRNARGFLGRSASRVAVRIDATRIALDDGAGILTLARAVQDTAAAGTPLDGRFAIVDGDDRVCAWSAAMPELTGRGETWARGRPLTKALGLATGDLAAGLARARLHGHAEQGLAIGPRRRRLPFVAHMLAVAGDAGSSDVFVLLAEPAEGGHHG